MHIATSPDISKDGRSALLLALVGLPGCTIAWALPGGGFWIGLPLAAAAIAIGVRAVSLPGRSWRGAAIVLAGAQIAFMAAWTVAG
jgi:hypothetical protein